VAEMRIVNQVNFPASRRKFVSSACETLSVLMFGFMAFALYAQKSQLALLWFLAAALSLMLGLHFERRFGLERKKTMGMLTPILLIGIGKRFGCICSVCPIACNAVESITLRLPKSGVRLKPNQLKCAQARARRRLLLCREFRTRPCPFTSSPPLAPLSFALFLFLALPTIPLGRSSGQLPCRV